ncbi:hypothetical protein K503DRAFT_701625, partial [Rhizopogon vinicolor AM-OR11-026]
DSMMRKWNCDTGCLVGEPWKWKGRGLLTPTPSPEGKMIAYGREDGNVER